MNAKLKKKIVAKMLKQGLCTQEEADTQNVSYDRLQMFIKGVEILEGAKTIRGQMMVRREKLKTITKKWLELSGDERDGETGYNVRKEKTKHTKMLKKLESIPENPNQESQEDVDRSTFDGFKEGGVVQKVVEDEYGMSEVVLTRRQPMMNGEEKEGEVFTTKFDKLDCDTIKEIKEMARVPIGMSTHTKSCWGGVHEPKTRMEAIHMHLKMAGEITAKDAFILYDVTRISDVIYKMKKNGMDITKEVIVEKDELYGGIVKRFKYVLNKK